MVSNQKTKTICYYILLIIVIATVYKVMSQYFYLIIDKQSDAREHLKVVIDMLKIQSIEDIKLYWGKGEYPVIWLYPIWHFGVALIISIVGKIELGYGVWNGILITITFIFTNYYMQKYTLKKKKYTVLLLSCMLLFVGPLYCNAINKDYYLGQFPANIWHNPSTMIIKPISVLIFFLYYDIMKGIKEANSIIPKKKVFIVAALLCFSAFCKPNWYQVFVPGVVGYAFVYAFFRQEQWKQVVKITVLVIAPVLLLAVVQFLKAFGGDGIGIGFADVWRHFSDNIVGSFAVSYLFPIVLLCFAKRRNNTMLHISLIVFFASFSQFVLFYRTANPWAGDFLWGVYLATYILFMVCVIELINSWRNLSIVGRILCTSCFLLHVFWGTIYWWSLQTPVGDLNPNFHYLFGI